MFIGASYYRYVERRLGHKPFLWYRTERREFRRRDHRKYRKLVNALLRVADPQDDVIIPVHPRTGGWLTH